MAKWMKAYSNDLRQKIVETNTRERESIQQTAKRFDVSYSFTWKLIKGYEQTGKVSPKPHGGGAKPKLNSSQLGIVAQLNKQKNDATLEELVIQLEETIGVKVSRATMGRVVLKLKLTRKKNFARNGARNRTGTAVTSSVLA
jgi:transposase